MPFDTDSHYYLVSEDK
jgi:hypothetical protein